MASPPEEFRSLVQSYLASGREDLDEHPAPEELRALQRGRLLPEDRQRVLAHLPRCPACTRLALVLGEPPRRELVRQLAAAVLFLAVLGLSLWSLRLRLESRRLSSALQGRTDRASALSRELERERRRADELAVRERAESQTLSELRRDLDEALAPHVNTAILDLASPSFRGRSSEPAPQVPPGADLVTLVLQPDDSRAFPSYEADVVAPPGRLLWTLAGLRRTEFGSLTVTLAPRAIPAESIRLLLWGVKDGKRAKLGQYELRVPRAGTASARQSPSNTKPAQK